MTDDGPYLLDCGGRRFPLSNPVTRIGRSAQCEVFVPDPRASRRHTELRWDGETCTCIDLDSANGTCLNGRRITTPEKLQEGDEITVASAVFTFHDPDSTLHTLQIPRLVVDSASGEIWVDRNLVSLSPKERALFELFYRNMDRPCSKQQIAEAVWPEYQAQVFDYQIESLVKRLREKLEPDPAHPVIILTVHGRGYKLVTA